MIHFVRSGSGTSMVTSNEDIYLYLNVQQYNAVNNFAYCNELIEPQTCASVTCSLGSPYGK